MTEVTIRELRAEDEQAVREFVIKEFFPIEPMCKAVRVDAHQHGSLWCDAVFPKCLNDGLSVVAFDSSTENLIGIRFAAAVYKNEKEDPPFSKKDPETRKLALLHETDLVLLKDLDFFEKYSVEKLVNFRGLCVAKSHQNRGIATKMVVKSLDLSREKGFPLVRVESSGVFSARIFEKLGFDKLREMRYEEFLIDGKSLDMTDDLKFNKGFILYTKVL